MALREYEACPPSRRTAAGGRLDRVHVVASARQRPCTNRVGVPHFAGTQFVSWPQVSAGTSFEQREESCDPSFGSSVKRPGCRRLQPHRECGHRASNELHSGTRETDRATGSPPVLRRRRRGWRPRRSAPAPSPRRTRCRQVLGGGRCGRGLRQAGDADEPTTTRRHGRLIARTSHRLPEEARTSRPAFAWSYRPSPSQRTQTNTKFATREGSKVIHGVRACRTARNARLGSEAWILRATQAAARVSDSRRGIL